MSNAALEELATFIGAAILAAFIAGVVIGQLLAGSA